MLLVALAFLLKLFSAVTSSYVCSENPSVYSFSLGSISARVVHDGTINNPASPFGAFDEAVERSYSSVFRPSFPFELSTNPLIMDMPYGRVLFETGAISAVQLPAFVETGRLIPNMKAVGVDPSSIRYIFISHAHFGHPTGLVDEDGNKLYPNAKVFVSQIEHEFWFPSPPQFNISDFPPVFEPIAALYRKNIIPYLDDLVLLQDNDEPLEGIKVLFTPGHSPGHLVFKVSSGKKSLLVIGDVWFTKPDQVQNPDWSFSLDTEPLTAYQSRIRMLDLAVKEKPLVLAFHEAFPGLGYVKSDGAFFDWEPLLGVNLGEGIGLQCTSSNSSKSL